MWVCGFILALVTVSIVFFRYRQRDTREPSQNTGNTKLEIAWTVVPIAPVTLLFVTSVMAARSVPNLVVLSTPGWTFA